jgi:hypothetical protein
MRGRWPPISGPSGLEWPRDFGAERGNVANGHAERHQSFDGLALVFGKLRIALLVDQESELGSNVDSSVREHFLPLLEIAGVQPIVAARLVAELCMPRPGSMLPPARGPQSAI